MPQVVLIVATSSAVKGCEVFRDRGRPLELHSGAAGEGRGGGELAEARADPGHGRAEEWVAEVEGAVEGTAEVGGSAERATEEEPEGSRVKLRDSTRGEEFLYLMA